jgi:hypothetical protein
LGEEPGILAYHRTTQADKIRENGFSLQKENLGRGWGEGVYVALDEETMQVYESVLPKGETLSVRVNVRNVFTPDLENTISGGGFQQVDVIHQALGVTPAEAKRILAEKGIAAALQEAGYDALVIPIPFNRQMVVFNPSNVKIAVPVGRRALGGYLLPDAVSDSNALKILQRMREESISKAAVNKYVNQKSAQYGKAIGVGKSDVREEILTPWAWSSNDTELRSLTMQKRSETLFGTKMSAWQEEELAKTVGASEKLNAPSVAQYRRPFQLVAETPEKATELTDEALKAIHDDTQAMFAEMGMDNVTVYRGFLTKPGESLPTGETLDIGWVNALESWTVDPVVAYNYAEERGVIIAASVPVKRILGTSLQGLGAFGDKEVVVMGSMLDKTGETVRILKGTGEVFDW